MEWRGDIVSTSNSVRGKEGNKLFRTEVDASKAVQNLVGRILRLRNKIIGSCSHGWRTSNRKLDLRGAWAKSKTEGTSELNTIYTMLVE